MKLSRKVGLILGAVIIVVALVSVYMVYRPQAGERDDLHAQLSGAQTLIPGLAKQKQDLEAELAQVQSSLSTSQVQFPQAVESIEYDVALFAIAHDCNVEITKLTVSPPAGTTVGTITYSVSSFVVVITGNIDNILKFINAIRTGGDLQLPWSAEVTGINTSMDSATINLNIYGYKR
jgi:hypothetical protein